MSAIKIKLSFIAFLQPVTPAGLELCTEQYFQTDKEFEICFKFCLSFANWSQRLFCHI